LHHPEIEALKQWYTVFGTLPSPRGIRPVVCLHGGPGVPHDCIRAIKNLYNTHNIPVIMYDQIGCGRSTHLPEKKGDQNFWVPELFLAELDNLLSHLRIRNDYDLLGQSWGGNLAAEHAVLQPEGLKRLILADSPADSESVNHHPSFPPFHHRNFLLTDVRQD
jgi:proline-specific peptidase